MSEDDIILYIDNPKDYQKSAELINEFSKAGGYKINIKYQFLHIDNKLSEREIKKVILFAVASKRIKYLGINLIKEVKCLYTKIYKLLMREIEEDKHTQKEDTPCS